jgi:hypothetical protein
MKKQFVALVGSLAVVALSVPALAQDDPEYTPGAWHFRSVGCVDTTVRSVQPRLSTGNAKPTAEDFKMTGVGVAFNTHLGVDPLSPNDFASVVHYQGSTGNPLMISERAGDKVQVCFLGPPPPTKYCDPDKDSRGRMYRVWDYQRKAQYWGGNSQHGCGGA